MSSISIKEISIKCAHFYKNVPFHFALICFLFHCPPSLPRVSFQQFPFLPRLVHSHTSTITHSLGLFKISYFKDCLSSFITYKHKHTHTNRF